MRTPRRMVVPPRTRLSTGFRDFFLAEWTPGGGTRSSLKRATRCMWHTRPPAEAGGKQRCPLKAGLRANMLSVQKRVSRAWAVRAELTRYRIRQRRLCARCTLEKRGNQDWKNMDGICGIIRTNGCISEIDIAGRCSPLISTPCACHVWTTLREAPAFTRGRVHLHSRRAEILGPGSRRFAAHPAFTAGHPTANGVRPGARPR